MTAQKISSNPLRWLAVLILVGCLGLTAINAAYLLAPCARLTIQTTADWLFRLNTLGTVIFAIVGCLIIFYQPHNRIGWLCLVIGFTGAMGDAITSRLICFLELDPLPTRFVFMAWVDYAVVPPIGLVAMFTLLPMLFPTGRFLSPRWRNVFLALLGVVIIAQVIVGLTPDLRQPNFLGITYATVNPFAVVPASWAATASNIGNLASIFGAVLGVISMVVRFRRARGDERQQLIWLAYFFGTFVAIQIILFEWLIPRYVLNNPALEGAADEGSLIIVYAFLINIVFIGFPLIIGLTIFKYRLYDIDIIIRRTVQYAIVSAVLAVTYFGSITLIQGGITAVTATQSPLAIVLSTLLIAALFNPLRQRVQAFIDRRFYRQKYDAQQVLAQFAETARDEVEMEALQAELLRVVQETMQPSQLSIWVKNDGS